MSLVLPKSLANLSGKFSSRAILHVTKKMSWYMLILVFLAGMVWLGYTWYFFIRTYSWTEQQKTSYRNEYAGEATFRTEKFQRTLSALQKREEQNRAGAGNPKDIFAGN